MFAHHLALRMGEVNVSRMLRKITMDQLITWMAYTRICGPMDDARQDAGWAALRMDLHNIHRGQSVPKSIEPFLPKFEAVAPAARKWSGWEYNKQMAYIIAGRTAHTQ